MPHDLIQVLLDPRAWFAFGIVFFSGFALAGEISQRRENDKKPPLVKDDPGDGGA